MLLPKFRSSALFSALVVVWCAPLFGQTLPQNDKEFLSAAKAHLASGGSPNDHLPGYRSPMLVIAANSDYVDSLKFLLFSGADPNLVYEKGSALDNACSEGNLESARLLIESGAKVNGMPAGEFGPLFWASERDQKWVVDLLISQGADVNAAVRGITPLIAAAENSTDEVTRRLIAAGAHVNVTDDNGDNPLQLAVEQGQPSTVADLLEAHADATKVDKEGCIPLHYARDPLTVDLLVKAAPKTIDLQDTDHETPLLCAMQRTDFTAAEALIRQGADVTLGCFGSTPLHEAAERGAPEELLALLVSHGAKIDAVETEEGFTPLHYAAQEGNLVAVKFLLSHGANRDALSKSGKTPLDIAREKANLAVGLLESKDLPSSTQK